MLITRKDASRFRCKYRLLNDCWVWIGRKDSKDYGLFDINGKPYFAHRISYLIHKGDFEQHLYVCHKCNNPPCVNPDHLYVGTQLDNMTDCINQDRQAYGERQGNHILTEKDVREIRYLLEQNITHEEISKKYGISRGAISRISNRTTWRQLDKDIIPDERKQRTYWNQSLTDEQIREIRFQAGLGLTHIDLAIKYNVSRPTITNIINLKKRRDVK